MLLILHLFSNRYFLFSSPQKLREWEKTNNTAHTCINIHTELKYLLKNKERTLKYLVLLQEIIKYIVFSLKQIFEITSNDNYYLKCCLNYTTDKGLCNSNDNALATLSNLSKQWITVKIWNISCNTFLVSEFLFGKKQHWLLWFWRLVRDHILGHLLSADLCLSNAGEFFVGEEQHSYKSPTLYLLQLY